MKRPEHWFRPDVDGLRAVAIVAVVLFHAGVSGFAGGFTGVDVFFVISGFLITRNLLHTTDTRGGVGLADFWARRIRRLVPALALVVVATLVASWLLMPTFTRRGVAEQALAASLYLSNLFFASQATNYFADDVTSSPFLHTWSLGVEEQFYVVWPILIALVCWGVARRARRRDGATGGQRRALVVLFAVVFVVSFVHNLVAAGNEQAYAFYSLTTRAWEFAAAGLLAAMPLPRRAHAPWVRSVTSVAGLGLIGFGIVTITQSASYPGWHALVPVIGTLLVIAAGDTAAGTLTRPAPSRVLASAPAQWLGRVSYSWYLWHWPAMVIATRYFASSSVALRATMGLVTLPVAWVAYRFFETPIRFAPVLSASALRTFAAGAAVTVIVAASSLALRPSQTLAQLAVDQEATLADLLGPADASMEARVSRAVELYTERSQRTCPRDGVPLPVSGDIVCYGGDTTGEATLMLLGDSHAGQWRRPFDQLAREHDFRLVVREHDGCAPLDIDREKTVGDDAASKREVCQRQQAGDLRVIREVQPTVVVMAFWANHKGFLYDDDGRAVDDHTEQVAIWKRELIERIEQIQQTGAVVAVIIDEPLVPFSPPDCLIRHGDEAKCTFTPMRAALKGGALRAGLREAVRETGSVMMDLTPRICPDQCQTMRDGMPLYADEHHLSDAYALSLKDDLLALVVSAAMTLPSPA